MTDPLGLMWGKSDAGGSMHLLIAHLLDTAAVAELIWDRYLAGAVRRELDACTGGHGRMWLSLVCGLHDVGKATPAFQSKDADLAAVVRQAGFDWSSPLRNLREWHHTFAGAVIVRTTLSTAGWNRSAWAWVRPLISGHHGRVPGADALDVRDRGAHGTGPWPAAQQCFVDRVSSELDVDLAAFADIRRPSRAVQLVVSGLVIMADWIASDDRHFGGVASLERVSMRASRDRALAAWTALGLRGGWDVEVLRGADERDLVRARFGRVARPFQRDVVAMAERMPAPGLLIVEAPMGEGKTEAALAAAEVLARRFGADGVFVGMPTQATSDPMFGRVRAWLNTIDSEVPVALLHGRSRFNQEWMDLRRAARFNGVGDLDMYGMADDFGAGPECCSDGTGAAAAEWFLGRKRGLLAPVAVGTVDQLLHAATRTRHVMLRHAGLAGRVVILDEVHAYDVYMSQFLFEALRWLGDAGVPVLLLSATLPPALRDKLMCAYAQGASSRRDIRLGLGGVEGYPRATAVTARSGGPPVVDIAVSAPWRTSVPVRVELASETAEFEPSTVAGVVIDEVRSGGCALVVCNTVDRAQQVYRRVREEFGSDAVLLHARLTAAARAERTERLVDQLGVTGKRPCRLVIVATQIAEQSFDVDVDLLVTDLAPIDLLLQRVGRMHRHERPASARPPGLRKPRVVVGGVCFDGGVPRFPRGSTAVYGEYPLLRAAALVEDAVRTGWSVPAQVPELVAVGYGDQPLGPDGWADRVEQARHDHELRESQRIANAKQFLLAGEDQLGTPTLDGLHDRHTADLDDEEAVAAVVRDGDESIEAVLVRRDGSGYRTLAGRPIGPQGEGVSDDAVLAEVAGSVVRLPARTEITAAARKELAPLSGWALDPWLSRTRALILEQNLSVVLGRHRLTYDDDLGLIVERRSGG